MLDERKKINIELAPTGVGRLKTCARLLVAARAGTYNFGAVQPFIETHGQRPHFRASRAKHCAVYFEE